jgi:flagellar biosynthetic protein FlhB
MAENEHNGTEAPTPRRRETARRDGQVVYSQDLASAATLLMGCLALLWTGPTIIHSITGGIRSWLTDVPKHDWTPWHTHSGARWLSSELLSSCGLLVGILMVTGVALALLQVGFTITTKPLQVNFEKILPTRGFSRIFSLDSSVRGVLGGLKVGVLTSISVLYIWLHRKEFHPAQFGSVAQLLEESWSLGLTVGMVMAGLIAGLAVIDYIVKWQQNEKKLRMTREEIKQEQKDDSGDPHLRAAARKKQKDRIRQRSTSRVREATMIVTNPTHIAVALKYEAGKMQAPVVVAKGAGVFAANIIRIGRAHNVPVMERKPLARALYASVRVGQEIPLEFFRAVAEILAGLYRTRSRKPA